MDSLSFFSAISGSLAVLVAVTFLYAAWGKLRSPGSVEAGMESLGVSTFLRHRLFSGGLPWLEIVIALGLLLAPAPWFAVCAAGALILSTAFLVTVWLAAAKDEPASCNCFGTKKTPVSWWTVVRNGVLTVVSGLAFAAAMGSPGVLWREDLVPAIIGFLGLALAALGGVAVAPELMGGEQRPEAVKRSSELGLRNSQLQVVNLPSIARETPIVLVFTKSGCPACDLAADAVREWSRRTAGLATARLVLNESPENAQESYPDLADQVLLDSGKMAARLMSVTRFPTAFLIGRDGSIATGAIEGSPEISDFLDVLGDSLFDASAAAQ
ncbi:MauE/DoxX family redox-associated membrane protein [Pseudarthrobacter sp. J75]|uniref:MauE/DoxX family redox-associated membrane protein n=1 Tax=unclassified Pseudarthrobacter TaxID=2647000 RepID=UPI002E8134F4|nr:MULTISPECIES: MauE/DoxX family redox-associated membrane protein [unclassified Pseudarthrobacter]MEE2523988.1 MauE/DoxX family redox-associated membrane protein [Pseudarthrobacter sp. J47]MEE2528244.1 MauE/DoxX family redox-associated membrane protein [Pseudarthrobacter sp. J75]